jgi:hypothetical protein
MEESELLEEIISEIGSSFYFYTKNDINLYPLRDLCETGVSFYSNKPFKRNEFLFLYLPLCCEPCLIHSEVKWCRKNKENNNFKYGVGCEFDEELPEEILEDISSKKGFYMLSKRKYNRRKAKKGIYVLVDRVDS